MAAHDRLPPNAAISRANISQVQPRTIWKHSCKRKRHRPQILDQAAVIMNALYQFTKLQYAVIQLSSITDPPEQLVLAYRDERTLRALIAGPSIVGLGFGSR